jgi:hypothetical protein
MARKKANKAKGKARGGLLLPGLVCGAGAAVAPATCAVLAVLLAPAIVMVLVDREPGRPAARAILLCGSAACVGPLITTWRMGGDSTWTLLSDSTVIGCAWAACALGWLLSQVLPVALRIAFSANTATRSALLRAERERLTKAWRLEDG